jgi:hypothetical protein
VNEGFTTPASSNKFYCVDYILFQDFSHPFVQYPIPKQNLLKEGKFVTGILFVYPDFICYYEHLPQNGEKERIILLFEGEILKSGEASVAVCGGF